VRTMHASNALAEKDIWRLLLLSKSAAGLQRAAHVCLLCLAQEVWQSKSATNSTGRLLLTCSGGNNPRLADVLCICRAASKPLLLKQVLQHIVVYTFYKNDKAFSLLCIIFSMVEDVHKVAIALHSCYQYYCNHAHTAMTTHSFIKQWNEYLGNGCSSSIIAHVIVQSHASELLGILHQLCQRGAGVDGAAHILECQFLQRWLQ